MKAKRKDAYEVLGVPMDADGHTVKQAYRKKARKAHPDAGGEKEQFQELSRAYRLLADPAKRAEYDRVGDAADTVQTLRQKAEAVLATMLVQCISQCGAKVNVWQKVRDVAGHSKAQNEAQAEEAAKKGAEFKEAAKRLTTKSGEPTHLQAALTSAADECARRAKAAIAEAEKFAEVIAVLEELKYRHDEERLSLTHSIILGGYEALSKLR